MSTSWLEELDLQDRDKLAFTFGYLLHNQLIDIQAGTSNVDFNQMIYAIESQFKHKNPDDKSRLAQARHIAELYRSYQIQPELLDWIDEKNPRQCYYIWCLIRLVSGVSGVTLRAWELLHSPNYQIVKFELRDYELLNLSQTPSSSAECKDNIIKFFKRWRQAQEFKIELIDCLKRDWIIKNEFKHKIFNHIMHDNHEHGRWFWNYLVDKANVPRWFLAPTTDSECFACAFAILHVWQVSSAEKTLMLNKAYSNFYNSGPKQKLDDERGANIWLNADYLNQLNAIARKQGSTTKHVLKRLISTEFDKITK